MSSVTSDASSTPAAGTGSRKWRQLSSPPVFYDWAGRVWPWMAVLATVLAVGSWVAFVWGLNLQFQVWPSFISG